MKDYVGLYTRFILKIDLKGLNGSPSSNLMGFFLRKGLREGLRKGVRAVNFNIFYVRAYLYSVVTEKTRKRKEIETVRDYKVQSEF